jgi:hypothetical protein
VTTLHSTTLIASRTWRASQSPFTSPAHNWPSQVMRLELVIATADFTQSTQHATLTFEKSTDSGASWQFVAEATFDGGTDRHGPITPGIIFSPDPSELAVAFQVRARMATSGPNFTGALVANWETEP